MAGLPARDRGRRLRDRRDGQGRRPLLLLPDDEAAARQPAGLAAAGRRRPRRHQRGAGRLRRQGDGPPRPPARPRRRGVPPGQPGAAAGRRHGQRVLRGGRARRRSPRRSTGGHHRRAARRCSRAQLRPLVARSTAWSRSAPVQAVLDQTVGRLGIPAEVLAHTVVHRGLRLAAHREGAGRLRHRGARPRGVRAHPVGLLGGEPRRRPPAATRSIREALKGKYVVITGASSGIGQVTALKVAQAGGIPVLVARGKDKLEETRATIERARRHGVRLPVRPLRPRGDRRAVRADHHRAAVGRLRRQQRRPLDPPVAAGCRTTGSTTSSAPCSSTTSARSGWSWG